MGGFREYRIIQGSALGDLKSAIADAKLALSDAENDEQKLAAYKAGFEALVGALA
jgi:hypothetical protein